MVNGSRFYTALESVSIASALSTALYHLSVPDPSPSTLTVLNFQLLTARKKEWWPATADSLPQAVTCQLCDTHYGTLAGIELTTFRLLVRRAIYQYYRDHR